MGAGYHDLWSLERFVDAFLYSIHWRDILLDEIASCLLLCERRIIEEAAGWAISPRWPGRRSPLLCSRTSLTPYSSTALDSYVAELGNDISYDKRYGLTSPSHAEIYV